MKLLDLFCGAGGAAMGYHRAGFEVVGVDCRPQPRYPFPFVRGDALRPPFDLRDFAVIHASPPCQAYTRAGKLREAQGGAPRCGDLLGPTRRLLEASGVPWVIENVEGAPLSGCPALVCGSALSLGVRRHRLFECSRLLFGTTCRHRRQGRPVGVYHRLGDDIPSGGRTAHTLEEAKDAMGIDWMTWEEIKEAVPPAYTEWIGRQLIRALTPLEAPCSS